MSLVFVKISSNLLCTSPPPLLLSPKKRSAPLASIRELQLQMANPSLCLLLLLASITSSHLLLAVVCTEGDTLNQSQSLRDGEILRSQGPSFFQLGFFAPNGSTSKTGKTYLAVNYVGPSYGRLVWVANRETPITDSATAVANISADGTLRLYQGSKLLWQIPNNIRSTNAVALQLLHTGNLVVKDIVTGRWLWQSFDHPTDTMLPTMLLGKDAKTGRELNLTSWKSKDDPSPGGYTFALCEGGGRSREMCITETNSNIHYRTGPWNGKRFSGNSKVPEAARYINFSFVVCESGTYYSFDIVPNTEISMSWMVMNSTGTSDREAVRANESRTLWTMWSMPSTDYCDYYNPCGLNGLCSNGACDCLPGFRNVMNQMLVGLGKPKCERDGELRCGEGDGFRQVQNMKLPDTLHATTEVNRSISLEGCKAACKANCSCVAYAAADVITGTGCIRWSGDLLDARNFSTAEPGQDDILFFRVPASLVPQAPNTSSKRRKAIAASMITLVAVIILVLCGLYVRKMSSSTKEIEIGFMQSMRSGATNLEEELSFFGYAAIAKATRNFSDKIGEGGFGIVYKGILEDGRVVAVKRLTKHISEQGLDGFLNEAALIAKLQHKNLIRLLGCCTEGGERMLVYEYMCNGSLDTFIFDERLRGMLDWTTRANIIVGVARGLVYLHEDSRLKIIHRDLKAGNVLLDEAMNPKISDFGSARLFVADQAEDNTLNVVGTIGYISPEYALDGIFSVKSDVFSFGVLMLEIISGRKNMNFQNIATFQEVIDKNLLALAWRLWREGNNVELLDEKIQNSRPEEVRRFVQIGLLCVQDDADDRPTMSRVHSMLTNEEKRLEEPNKPGIYQGRVTTNKNQLKSSGSGSVGYMTTTVVEAR